MKKLISQLKVDLSEVKLTPRMFQDYLVILTGTFIQAIALRLFLVPADLATGGVSGIAQLVNIYTGWSIGLMIFVGNLPLFILGWRYLGGPRFALRTGFAVLTYAVFADPRLFFA